MAESCYLNTYLGFHACHPLLFLEFDNKYDSFGTDLEKIIDRLLQKVENVNENLFNG